METTSETPMASASATAVATAPSIVSSMPLPPQYYKLYSFYGKNISASDEVEVDSSFNLEDHLLFKPLPPPKPISGTYYMFGRPYTTEDKFPTLEEEGRVQLYPKETKDHIYELKKLNRSLLSKFLELLDYLTTRPEEFRSKAEEMELLFINMHHLINSYRPNEARQILISMMEEQIKRRQETMNNIDNCIGQLKEVYDNCMKILEEGSKIPAIMENREEERTSNITQMEKENMNTTKQDLNFITMKELLDSIPNT